MEPFVINPDNVPPEVADAFAFREACRGVVLDNDGNIGVLHSQTENFYKLAGGGVELGETLLQAFEREVKEELGVMVSGCEQFCTVLEIRREEKLRQLSHCYTARVIGEKGDTALEGWELINNMRHEWIPAEQVLKHIESQIHHEREAFHFMSIRDAHILKMYQEAKTK